MQRLLTVLLPVSLLVGCGSTSPLPTGVTVLVVDISAFTVTPPQPGSQAGIFNYTATFHLRNEGTADLTFTHVVFTALPSGIGVDQPGAFVAAGGTWDPVFPLAGFPLSTQIRVNLTYIDGHGHTGSAVSMANVPAQ